MGSCHEKCLQGYCKSIRLIRLQNKLSFEKTLKRNLVHIETQIEQDRLDLDISIDRQSYNFKGTIKKNQSVYEQALKCFTVIEKSKKSIELWMKSCK